MISSRGVAVEKRVKKTSPYLGYGVKVLTIKALTAEVASTGSVRAMFQMETEPVNEEGFMGLDGAKGQTGRVRTVYMKNEDQQKVFVDQLSQIADEIGVRDQLDAIEANNMEEYINKVAPLFIGKTARFLVAVEQEWYNGKLKDRLLFPKFDFVESLDIPANKSKLVFDKDKTYHFRPAAEPAPSTEGEITEATAVSDDLPF